jgi:hypothetical protein
MVQNFKVTFKKNIKIKILSLLNKKKILSLKFKSFDHIPHGIALLRWNIVDSKLSEIP